MNTRVKHSKSNLSVLFWNSVKERLFITLCWRFRDVVVITMTRCPFFVGRDLQTTNGKKLKIHHVEMGSTFLKICDNIVKMRV